MEIAAAWSGFQRKIIGLTNITDDSTHVRFNCSKTLQRNSYFAHLLYDEEPMCSELELY
jgi:hypothetical protein